MFNLSMPELILVLVIALVVFGPGKLPEVGKALGKGLGEFRKAMSSEQPKNEVITVEARPVETKDEKGEIKKTEETK